ncbi:MAG: radical SAM protein [Oscillospiraceae bacterium]|nr:radical SAM protein [Oscillospiraceae bacterium]
MKTPRRRVFPVFIPHLGCPQQCVFCDQHEITGCRAPVDPEAVARALSALPDRAGLELAFYGGSFTALPADYQKELLCAALPAREREAVSFLRLSTRPDAVSPGELDLLRRFDVRTIELGVQSMDEEVLRLSRRGHSARDTRDAAHMVKEYGFQLILQMMTGLPGSSEDSDLRTAEELIALGPDGVRIYPAVILRGTELERQWRQGLYREHTVEDAVRLCARIVPRFEANAIPVIRLGLNPTEELSGGQAVGGAYHPALGELVRSRILRQKAEELLSGVSAGSAVTLGVSPRRISAMTGQHRCNIDYLQQTFRLSCVKVAAANTAGEGVVLLASGEKG